MSWYIIRTEILGTKSKVLISFMIYLSYSKKISLCHILSGNSCVYCQFNTFYFIDLNLKLDAISVRHTYMELLNFSHRTIYLNSNQSIMYVMPRSLLTFRLYSRILSLNTSNTSKQYTSMDSSFTIDQLMNKDKDADSLF